MKQLLNATVASVINGFDEKEIFVLYNYVCWFEKIKSLKTDRSLYSFCPQQKQFWIHFSSKQFDFKSEKGSQMPAKVSNQKSNTILFTLSAKTRQLSFLRHLRNSIAHGLIVCKGKTIEITDYNSRSKRLSCMGNLSKSSLMTYLQSFL